MPAGGNDLLTGPNANATWDITAGTLTSAGLTATFTNFEDLQGGTANDTFVFSGAGTLPGSINGGLGTDTLDYTAIGSAINVNVQTSQADRIASFAAIESFAVSSGTFTGLNAAGTWTLNGGTSVTYVSTNTYNLTGFSTLQAGTAVDTFNVQANASGNLRGGLGNDIFNLNASLTGSISGEGDNDTLAGTQVTAVTLVGSVDSGTEDSLCPAALVRSKRSMQRPVVVR